MISFNQAVLSSFRLRVEDEYPLFSQTETIISLSFATTYIGQTEFSAVTNLTTKYRSRITVDSWFTSLPAEITPRIDKLCSKKQSHPFNWCNQFRAVKHLLSFRFCFILSFSTVSAEMLMRHKMRVRRKQICKWESVALKVKEALVSLIYLCGNCFRHFLFWSISTLFKPIPRRVLVSRKVICVIQIISTLRTQQLNIGIFVKSQKSKLDAFK